MLSQKGKCKSQCGGSETVFVKKEIPWPQNYILGGNLKSRVSYDNLSISQWVSGFATIIRDEKIQMLNNVCLIILQKSWTIVVSLGAKQLRGHMWSWYAG